MERQSTPAPITVPSLPSLDSLSDTQRARITEFNARPARRSTDIRVRGWQIVEGDL